MLSLTMHQRNILLCSEVLLAILVGKPRSSESVARWRYTPASPVVFYVYQRVLFFSLNSVVAILEH